MKYSYFREKNNDDEHNKLRISGSLKFEGFVQVYLDDSDLLHKLSGLEYRVLSICVLAAEWFPSKGCDLHGNKFVLSSDSKKLILEKAGVNANSLYPTLRRLVKKNLLIKDNVTRGVFYLNPRYMFKGSIINRMRLVKKSLNDLLVSDDPEKYV